VLSDVVFDELRKCEEPKKSFLMASLSRIRYEFITADKAAVELAGKFIDFGILRKGMTSEEICEDTRKSAEEFLKQMEQPNDPAIVCRG